MRRERSLHFHSIGGTPNWGHGRGGNKGESLGGKGFIGGEQNQIRLRVKLQPKRRCEKGGRSKARISILGEKCDRTCPAGQEQRDNTEEIYREKAP